MPPLHPVSAQGGAPGSERARPPHPPGRQHPLRQAAHRPVHAEGRQGPGGGAALLKARHRHRQHRGGPHGDVLREVGEGPRGGERQI